MLLSPQLFITFVCCPAAVLYCRGMLHSNPMDYAWGASGLDEIITQVEQFAQKKTIYSAVV